MLIAVVISLLMPCGMTAIVEIQCVQIVGAFSNLVRSVWNSFNIDMTGCHPLKPAHMWFYPIDHIAIIELAGLISGCESKKKKKKKFISLLWILPHAIYFSFTMKDKSAMSTVKALSRLISQVGPPKIIQSDNGTEFTNDYCTQN